MILPGADSAASAEKSQSALSSLCVLLHTKENMEEKRAGFQQKCKDMKAL